MDLLGYHLISSSDLQGQKDQNVHLSKTIGWMDAQTEHF